MNKYILITKLSLLDLLTYRLDFVLHVIKYAGMIVFMSFIWLAVEQQNPNLVYSREEIVTYFIFAASLYSLSNFHTIYIEEDIKLGWLTKFLVKPISALRYYYHFEFGVAFFETFLKLIVMVPLIHFLVQHLSLQVVNVILFFLYLPFIFTFAFFQFSLISSFSFWIQEVYAIRWSLTIFFRFLSGAFIPLLFFPTWLQQLSQWLPYQYLLFIPIQIVTNKSTISQALTGLVVLGTWTCVLYLVRARIWRLGSKSYESTGI